MHFKSGQVSHGDGGNGIQILVAHYSKQKFKGFERRLVVGKSGKEKCGKEVAFI